MYNDTPCNYEGEKASQDWDNHWATEEDNQDNED